MFLAYILAAMGLLVLFSVPVVGVLTYVEMTPRYSITRRVVQAFAFFTILAVITLYVSFVGELHTQLLGGGA